MNDAKPVVKQVEELQIIILEMEVEDNGMKEKADANSIETNANMVGEIFSKSMSNHKNKGKMVILDRVIPKMWIHTGSTKYIYVSRRMFVSYQKVIESEPMFMGNEIALKIEGKGKVILKLTSGKDLVISNVFHVPNIPKNLISDPILSNNGFKLVFEPDKFVITKGGMHVEKGYLDEGLFKLSVVTNDNVINNNNAGTSIVFMYMIDPSFLWHSRLGHVIFCSLQRMINLGMLPKCSKDKISKCEICVESKFTSHSHKSVKKSNEILGLIHTGLCDFKATPLRGGKNYFITFIDDCSKLCYVYLINTKDEALNMFNTYKAEVENQLDKKIKILRSDRGGEYESTDFSEFCSTFGIVHQTTTPYTPQQNRVAERKNRTLKNMINSMLITSGAPHSYWGEACLAANTILNKIPHKKSDKSPYQLWKGKQPSYKRVKVWGCLAKNVEPRRSKHAKVTKYFGLDYMTYIVNEEPQTYKATMESSEASYWKEAIQSEIDLIVQNNTWKLVDLPSGHKPIGHKASLDFCSKDKMSRDVLTVGSTMRIPLLYRGEYSQWVERFMNYLEKQTDGEAMINSIKNGDQPLPRVTQVSTAGTSSTEQPPLKDKSIWYDQEKTIQKIDRLARSLLIQGLPNNIYSLIDSNKTTKDLWDALARHMLGSEYGEQEREAAVLYEYETFKATEGELLLDTYIRYLQMINDLKKCGDVNDAMGSKKKTVVVTSNPLALIAEKTKVSNSKEKVVVSSDSKGSEADDFS
nr:polyprotein, putative [Tanacetum cinerariifolium]